jgi:hypothetical protein
MENVMTPKSPVEKTNKPKASFETVKGVEKVPSKKEDFAKEGKKIAEEVLKNEEEIVRIQEEIRKIGYVDTEEKTEEKEEKLDIPLNESEIKVFNNLGYDRESIEKLKNKFKKMKPGQAYNEMQILGVEEMIKFLSNKEEYQPGKLIGKLKIILEELKNINNNGDTIKPFNSIMENANEATSSVLMEDLNKALKESGYKGKVLGIFGKKSSIENFQGDLIKTFLNEEMASSFEKIENNIKKDGSKYEKSSGMSGLAQGASQIQRNYGKNGLKVKIEDVANNI